MNTSFNPADSSASSGVRDPFGDDWTPVSIKLISVRRISVLAPLGIAVLLTAVLLAILAPPWVGPLVVAAGLVGLLWASWLIGRQVRATGYLLRPNDLLVVSGVMFRRLVIVPYGRMQLVDVSRGPIDRYFGLATVQLHTAAATTDATIPGLQLEDAAELRDRLASLGEERSAGL